MGFSNACESLDYRAWAVSLFVSLSAFAVYNLDRLLPGSEQDAVNSPSRVGFFYSYRQLLWPITLINLAVAIILFIVFLNMQTRLSVALAAFTGGLYFFISLNRSASVKNKGPAYQSGAFAKPFLLAITWGLMLTIPAFLMSRGELSVDNVLLLFSGRAVWVFMNNLWFEMRDFSGDNKAGRINFFQVVSPHSFVLWQLYGALLSVLIYMAAVFFYELNALALLELIIPFFYMVYALKIARHRAGSFSLGNELESFYYLKYDGILLIPPLLILFF